jgi:hypothetical protein
MALANLEKTLGSVLKEVEVDLVSCKKEMSLNKAG